jgi:ankyrin repeat protein
MGCYGGCGTGCLGALVVAVAVGWFVLPPIYRREVGNFPLYQAIALSDTAEVRRLLDGGADPNAVSRGSRIVRREWKSERPLNDWDTPLILAVETGRRDVVTMLLDHGADVQQTRKHGGRFGDRYDGPTALAMAVEAGDLPMVELLLARGARATDLTRGERLPVVCDASEAGRAEIVRALVARGADANARCRGR